MPTIKLTAVLPKGKLYPPGGVKPLLRKALDKARPAIERDLKKIDTTWDKKIRWRIRYKDARGEMAVEITTTDKRYLFLDEGTGLYGPKHQKYPIPKPGNNKAKRLKFRTTYRAKTRPRVLQSVPGGSSGDVVIRKRVMHPGIKPREFSKIITRYHSRLIQRAVRDALRRIWQG